MLFICYFVICCFFGLYEMNLIENFCVLMNYIIKIIKKKLEKFLEFLNLIGFLFLVGLLVILKIFFD